MQESDWKYVYLEMPVSFEVKRAWNAKGYRVADMATMPEGYDNPADEKLKPKQQKEAKNAKTENASDQ